MGFFLDDDDTPTPSTSNRTSFKPPFNKSKKLEPRGNLVAKPKKSVAPTSARVTSTKTSANLPIPGMLHCILY